MKLPGVSATMFEPVASTGGMPVASSAGKVMMAAPPTSAEIVPPMMPAPTNIRVCRTSIGAVKWGNERGRGRAVTRRQGILVGLPGSDEKHSGVPVACAKKRMANQGGICPSWYHKSFMQWEIAMNVITVASRKGGSGKSTLIAHLSDFVHQSGRRCFVVAADPQGSLTLWNMLRAGNGVRLQSPGSSLAPLLDHARRDGVEWVFIDTPPTMNAAVTEAIGAATLVVIPARPALFDLLRGARDRGGIARLRQALCGRAQCDAAPAGRQGIAGGEQVREHLDGLAVPVWSGQISHRLGYALTLDAGAGIAAAQPDSSGAAEIARLWSAIERSVEAINGAHAVDTMHRAA